MAVKGIRENFSNLFLILTILMYLLGYLIIDRGLSFINLSLIIFALIIYYISNIFVISGKIYSLREMILVIIINFILLFLTIYFRMFGIYEGITLFGIISIFQIIFKYIVKLSFIKRQRIIFLGENNYTEDLINSILKDEKYKFIGTIKNENLDIMKRALLKLCEVRKTDIIVNFTENVLFDDVFVNKLLKYKLNGIQFYNYLEFYEMYTNKLPISHLSLKWFLENSGFQIYHNNFNLKLKRIIDVFFAIVIGIMSLPVMALAILIIKLESKGPIFFVQERVGKENKKFNIIKFRSMRVDAEKDGPKWASVNDNRITKWGKIMRATRIDELPQLWNVLKGDMSFVGPRPEREFFIEQLEKEIPYYNLRHTVKPGLTGWAQIMYPYGASIEDSYRKLQYDLYYIKYHDIILDMKIFLKTITVVIFGKGR